MRIVERDSWAEVLLILHSTDEEILHIVLHDLFPHSFDPTAVISAILNRLTTQVAWIKLQPLDVLGHLRDIKLLYVRNHSLLLGYAAAAELA